MKGLTALKVLAGGDEPLPQDLLELEIESVTRGPNELWEKLCEGGQPSRCGWLEDKFGLIERLRQAYDGR